MNIKRKPEWLRIKLGEGRNLNYVKGLLKKFSLNTVCEEANCPNQIECFSKKTATFMILGSDCSRSCGFCNVSHGALQPIDPNEPENVANAVAELGLKHVVITSVTRDDLADGGAQHFADVVNQIKSKNKETMIEVLIPDFQGNKEALQKVVQSKPDIINHNMETIPRLYPEIRPKAEYVQSLELLKNVKEMDPEILTKSGVMVGLGEGEEELIEVFKDLRGSGCDFLTVGQYLPPSTKHYPLKAYISPEVFERYKEEALKIGFSFVASSPLVRSSYNAAEALEKHEEMKS
ncbi:lipoic acid synthetase [Alkaliphilus metalliredigens QYMF]|uniref:Lipoyl synthase n=1 Tax=Alkaliphilus metalliredigens (strain QYMF) TaxID=293826 RepID=LIPA_ALKMQ|nr:RecName: Full=Lipoyl synthase; AltName: Full=Lip-syn; Short=LS; AltName: Full=Lipoate synthase; AltName: Full=Lipoic acid synthase; AltName: Full=Sulfur insertion protein LipA [Alkaliphilus metalliredigens QYMF]ABR50497.1 lipoic acid synthetase [Alkaliphilus metalliredigens QYMF]